MVGDKDILAIKLILPKHCAKRSSTPTYLSASRKPTEELGRRHHTGQPHKDTQQVPPYANGNARTKQMADGCGEANEVKEAIKT